MAIPGFPPRQSQGSRKNGRGGSCRSEQSRLVLQPQFGDMISDFGHRTRNAERLVSAVVRCSTVHGRLRERFWVSKLVVLGNRRPLTKEEVRK